MDFRLFNPFILTAIEQLQLITSVFRLHTRCSAYLGIPLVVGVDIQVVAGDNHQTLQGKLQQRYILGHFNCNHQTLKVN